jgi:hypothetical protein
VQGGLFIFAVLMEMTIISVVIIGAALFIALVLYRIVRGSDLKKK